MAVTARQVAAAFAFFETEKKRPRVSERRSPRHLESEKVPEKRSPLPFESEKVQHRTASSKAASTPAPSTGAPRSFKLEAKHDARAGQASIAAPRKYPRSALESKFTPSKPSQSVLSPGLVATYGDSNAALLQELSAPPRRVRKVLPSPRIQKAATALPHPAKSQLSSAESGAIGDSLLKAMVDFQSNQQDDAIVVEENPLPSNLQQQDLDSASKPPKDASPQAYRGPHAFRQSHVTMDPVEQQQLARYRREEARKIAELKRQQARRLRERNETLLKQRKFVWDRVGNGLANEAHGSSEEQEEVRDTVEPLPGEDGSGDLARSISNQSPQRKHPLNVITPRGASSNSLSDKEHDTAPGVRRARTIQLSGAGNAEGVEKQRSKVVTRARLAQARAKKKFVKKQAVLFEKYTDEEQMLLQTAFAICEIDEHGFLNLHKLPDALSILQLRPKCNVETIEVGHIVTEYHDAFGSVDFMGFATEMVPSIRQKFHELRTAVWRETFNMYDSNSSETISREDCREIVRGFFCLDLDLCSRQRLLKEFDDAYLDEHGEDGQLRFEGFQTLLATLTDLHDVLWKERAEHVMQFSGLDGPSQSKRGSSTTFLKQFDDLLLMYDSFERADFDSTGQVQAAELVGILREHGVTTQGDTEHSRVATILQKFGKRPRETISFQEFLAHIGEIRRAVFRELRVDLKRLFDRLDTDKSGMLSVTELWQMLDELGLKPRCRQDRDAMTRIINDADSDGNGELDWQEFCTVCEIIHERLRVLERLREDDVGLQMGFSCAQLQDLRQSFCILDANQQNALDIDAIVKLLKLCGKSFGNAQVKTLFHQVDVDSSGSIDFEEFLQLIRFLEVGAKDARRASRKSLTGEEEDEALAQKYLDHSE